MDGAVAQLGERYNGIVEVRGSIPLGSTKLASAFACNTRHHPISLDGAYWHPANAERGTYFLREFSQGEAFRKWTSVSGIQKITDTVVLTVLYGDKRDIAAQTLEVHIVCAES